MSPSCSQSFLGLSREALGLWGLEFHSCPQSHPHGGLAVPLVQRGKDVVAASTGRQAAGRGRGNVPRPLKVWDPTGTGHMSPSSLGLCCHGCFKEPTQRHPGSVSWARRGSEQP